MSAHASRVTLALFTHSGIGSALLAQARRILDDELTGTVLVEIGYDEAPPNGELQTLLDKADQGAGVLVLADLPCATPCNRALSAARRGGYHVVSGLNLPMLIRAWNYRDRPVERLAEIAAEGGRKAIEVLA